MKTIKTTMIVIALLFATAVAREASRGAEALEASPTALNMTAMPQASPTPLETLIDRCSTSVRIEPSLIYAPNQQAMVSGSQAPIRLKRPANKNAFTDWTDKRAVGLTPSGRFAWYCGPYAYHRGGTLEHSNCPTGTNAMKARLGPDRRLEIQCLPE